MPLYQYIAKIAGKPTDKPLDDWWFHSDLERYELGSRIVRGMRSQGRILMYLLLEKNHKSLAKTIMWRSRKTIMNSPNPVDFQCLADSYSWPFHQYKATLCVFCFPLCSVTKPKLLQLFSCFSSSQVCDASAIFQCHQWWQSCGQPLSLPGHFERTFQVGRCNTDVLCNPVVEVQLVESDTRTWINISPWYCRSVNPYFKVTPGFRSSWFCQWALYPSRRRWSSERMLGEIKALLQTWP